MSEESFEYGPKQVDLHLSSKYQVLILKPRPKIQDARVLNDERKSHTYSSISS